MLWLRPLVCLCFVFVPCALFANEHPQRIIKAHGISTFGELKYAADFPHLDYVNPNAPKGGEISTWAFGGFDSVNPYTIKGRSDRLATLPYESLLTSTADEIGASYGLLAESIEYPPDRAWVIFTIRPEARFANDAPVTAEDVAFSYQLFLEKGLPSYRVQLAKQVNKVEILSPHRIKFTFNTAIPTRDLPQNVGALPIFSKTDYIENKRDLAASSLSPFVGSGAYVLDRMDIGKTSVYRRRPDYWGKDLPINKGQDNFDFIRIEYYADYNAAFEGFKAGTYTFRDEAASKLWATGYTFPALQKGIVIKATIPHSIKATGQAFIFNLRREKFKDPRVREAIALMFNFEWSNKTLFYDLYERINSFWDNSQLKATGLPSPEEKAIFNNLDVAVPNAVLNNPAFVWPRSSTDRQLDRKQLRRAARLLDAAGWTTDAKGVRRNAKGDALTVEFLNDSQTFDRVINPYVENLKRLGIDAYHTRIDHAQMESRESPPHYDFDIITLSLNTNYIPGSELRQYFGSETANTSVFNKMGLQSPLIDALIDRVIAANTKADLTHSVHALDRALRYQKFWIPQWNKNVYTIAYYNMYDYPKPLPPFALGYLKFWWYDTNKAKTIEPLLR